MEPHVSNKGQFRSMLHGQSFFITGPFYAVTDVFPSRESVAQRFDGLFADILEKILNKQWGGWWNETP